MAITCVKWHPSSVCYIHVQCIQAIPAPFRWALYNEDTHETFTRGLSTALVTTEFLSACWWINAQSHLGKRWAKYGRKIHPNIVKGENGQVFIDSLVGILMTLKE